MIILSPMVFTQFTGVFPARTFTPLLTPSSRNLHHAIPTIPSYRISSLALVPVQITELDEVLQDREVRARAILDADRDDRRRNIMSPPPAPAPPRIGLGGAVLRRGDRQVNFPSNRPTRFEDQAVPPPIRAQDPPPQVNGDRNYAALLERLANVENDRGGEDRDPMAYRRGLAAIYNQLGRGEALAMGLMPDPALQLAHPVPNSAFDGVLERFGMRDMLAGMDMQGIFGRAGGAGPGGLDIPSLLAKVEVPPIPPPTPGFTRDFVLDQSTLARSPIMIDDDGRVIREKRKKRPKPYIACASCPEPLLISSAYRTVADRVWTLRCGHMIDQRCLDALSTPKTVDEFISIVNGMPGGLEMLDSEPAYTKGGRAKRRRPIPKKTAPTQPAEYAWLCPVPGCGRQHYSVQGEKGWIQKEWCGAMQVYM